MYRGGVDDTLMIKFKFMRFHIDHCCMDMEIGSAGSLQTVMNFLLAGLINQRLHFSLAPQIQYEVERRR